VIYSDKSESSVEELMDETPSNYNIPNGRFEGKSQGLLYAMKHGNKGGKSPGKTRNDKNLVYPGSTDDKRRNKFRERRLDSNGIVGGNMILDSGLDDQTNNREEYLQEFHPDIEDDISMGTVGQYGPAHSLKKKKIKKNLQVYKKGRATVRQVEQLNTFNPQRIKALEVAYLTKLVPGKSSVVNSHN